MFSLESLIIGINLLIALYANLSKSDNTFRYCMTAISFIMVFYFVTLEMFNSATVVAIIGIRTLVSTKFKGSIIVGGFFFLLTASVPLWVADTDIIGVFAALIGTIAFFYLEGVKMRLAMACAAAVWIVGNVIYGSYHAIALESVGLTMNLIAAYRIHKSNKEAGLNPV